MSLLHPCPALRKAPGAPAFRENLFLTIRESGETQNAKKKKKEKITKIIITRNDLLIVYVYDYIVRT